MAFTEDTADTEITANRENRQNPTPELISTGKAARLLGVSLDTIQRLCDAEELWSLRIPNMHRRVRLSDIEALRQKYATPSTETAGADASTRS